MKKFLLLFLLFAGVVNAQIIVFDGTIFKNKLLQSSTSNSIAKDVNGDNIKIDLDNNGEITQLEASIVYELDVKSSSINNLTGLEYFINIRVLDCSQNDFTTIDISTLTFLTDLNVSNNSNLISIYAKNGAIESIDFGGNTPNVIYICADEAQIEDLTDDGPGNPNYIVDSYCTDIPGGNFNKISGKVLFDQAGNGIDASDIPQPNIKVVSTFDENKIETVTNSLGEFILNTTEIGSFNFQPVFEHPDWFSFTPTPAVLDFVNANNNVISHDFIVTPVGQHYDVEVIISPILLPTSISTLSPVYEIMFRNKGNQAQGGQISFSYNSSLLNSVSPVLPTNTVVSNQIAGLLTFGYTNLKPFESRVIRVSLQPITSFITGQSLQFSATINSDGEELSTQTDNDATLIQIIESENDACWIKCMEGNSLPSTEIGEYLSYTLNIENDEIEEANFVVAKVVIDESKFDMSSLQVLSSYISNPFAPIEYNKTLVQVENNEVIFQLRASMQGGEPGGQGGILFKIKTLEDLPVGSTVFNDTKITFNYDVAPLIVSTNTASTTFQNLNVSINTFDNSISVFPNPTSSFITIKSDVAIQSVSLYDVFGRLLQTDLTTSESTIIDISQRTEGTYFLKITSEKGQKVEKIMKN